MSHNQETRVIHNADIRRKYRTCGREARLLYLLPIIQGGRRTPKRVRTRHPKTHHRPTTTDIQRLVRLSSPFPVSLGIMELTAKLTFSLFPPKHSLPKKCLYSLRVWLRHQNIDQRIFADDALWVGTNPNFAAIPGASIATNWYQAPERQLYKCLVGRAEVFFILRWVLTLVSCSTSGAGH